MQKVQLRTTTGFDAQLEYNERGKLVAFRFLAEISDENHEKAMLFLPRTLADLAPFRKHKKCTVINITDEPPTFEEFWNAYGYKQGVKPNAQKYWAALPDADKIRAMERIKRYNAFLEKTGTAKVYPERYLKYRRWENDF